MDREAASSGRWEIVPILLGLVLVAAGAADGHRLVVERSSDWTLLGRADVELLGGLWLLGGWKARAARGVALAGMGALLLFDLARAAFGEAPRCPFGRVDLGPAWVVARDVAGLGAAAVWRAGARPASVGRVRQARLGLSLMAAMVGMAVEASQVGQWPILVTVRSGRTRSGLDYLVYLPDGYYRSLRRWPAILVLHGRGECGEDIGLVRSQGLPRRVEHGGGLPFVVIAPQNTVFLWDPAEVVQILDETLARFRVDPDRVYLVGNSMGGAGTWSSALEFPERFAAIAPICGAGNPDRAERLRNLPTWAFHGAEDRVVPPAQSERMVDALRAAGGDVRLTLYPGVGHDAWTRTFDDPAFYQWLLQHRRGGGH